MLVLKLTLGQYHPSSTLYSICHPYLILRISLPLQIPLTETHPADWPCCHICASALSRNPSCSQNRSPSISYPPHLFFKILIYKRYIDGHQIQLYINIQHWTPPDTSLTLWKYAYQVYSDYFWCDNQQEEHHSYQHQFRIRLLSPIVYPCPMLMQKCFELATVN